MTAQERAALEALMATAETPALVIKRPAWMADAACKETPGVNFFPERGQPTDPAREVCARCLVREDCRAYARAEAIPAGVWGGESPSQRVKSRGRRALRRAS